MSEEKKGQEQSADGSEKAPGGNSAEQKPEVKNEELSPADLEKVAGGLRPIVR
jgi:hypothetical protein